MKGHRSRSGREISRRRAWGERARRSALRPLAESLEDRSLLATITVNTAGDPASPVTGMISLRQAIQLTNGTLSPSSLDPATVSALISGTPNGPGPDTIAFSIPVSGPLLQSIAPTSPLPVITHPVIIDGYTQPGSSPNTLDSGDNAVINIELNGNGAGNGAGLMISAGNSTVRGLAINHFGGSGIVLTSAGGDTIQGNFIGTNNQGTAVAANAQDGITVQNVGNNIIGGADPSTRNLISGNGSLFTAPVVTTLTPVGGGASPSRVVTGHFGGTGSDDLAVLDPSASLIFTLLSNSDGTFQDPVTTDVGFGATDIAAYGSGLVVTHLASTDPDFPAPSDFTVLTSQGNGMFQVSSPVQAGPNPVAVAAGDLNNDGTDDVVVVNGLSSTSSGDVRVFFGIPGSNPPAFQPQPVILAAGTNPDAVAVGTLRFDATTGQPVSGVAVANGGSNNVSLFTSNGDGTFQAPVTLSVGTNPVSIQLADIQGNGLGDILTANQGSNNVSVLLQNTDGTFAGARNFATGNGPSSVVVGNFGNAASSFLGFAVSNTSDGTLSVYLRGATGSIRPPLTIQVGATPMGLAAGTQTFINPGTTTPVLALAVAEAATESSPDSVGAYYFNTASSAGVRITGSGATGNVVLGDYIGTNAGGAGPLPNIQDGVLIDSGASGNTVGGTAPGSGNLISGNDQNGVHIRDTTSTGNVVQGNLIGTDVTGSLTITGNANDGVLIEIAPGNTIGGSAPSARNIISGNQFNAVEVAAQNSFNSSTETVTFIDAPNNVIQGNFIGLDPSGNNRVTNFRYGVEVNGANNTSILGNVVSGNTNANVHVTGITFSSDGEPPAPSGSNNVIQGNFIGTNAAGTSAAVLNNGDDGIDIYNGASSNTIGGTISGQGNVISGNGDDGIQLRDTNTTGNLVLGNLIGTDVTGTVAIPNGIIPNGTNPNTGSIKSTSAAIYIGDSPGNTIGGTDPGARNVLSGNMGRGCSSAVRARCTTWSSATISAPTSAAPRPCPTPSRASSSRTTPTTTPSAAPARRGQHHRLQRRQRGEPAHRRHHVPVADELEQRHPRQHHLLQYRPGHRPRRRRGHDQPRDQPRPRRVQPLPELPRPDLGPHQQQRHDRRL